MELRENRHEVRPDAAVGWANLEYMEEEGGTDGVHPTHTSGLIGESKTSQVQMFQNDPRPGAASQSVAFVERVGDLLRQRQTAQGASRSSSFSPLSLSVWHSTMPAAE